MTHVRLQEIMGELRAGGRLNADDWALVCEMNALIMASKPDREIHPDIEAAEAKRARDRERMRVARQSHDSRATPHTPRVRNKNIKPPKPPLDASFDAWYLAYPKRRGRGAAEKAYTKALREGATAEELLAGAKRYAIEVRGREEQFVAFPATWLNQKRWLDEATAKFSTVTAGPWKPLPPEPPRKPRTPEEQAKIDAQVAKAGEFVSGSLMKWNGVK